ncbi:MAG: hypothetical protein M1820_006928 [Bogoriella megaspora]|nr:MAG: hypothetical protein M1820_006928 [Bogoriella megaspora]
MASTTPTAPYAALRFFEQHSHVEFVYYHWTDMSGVLRVRALPKSYALKLATENKPLKAGAFALIGLMSSSTLPKGFRPGSASAICPDWSSLRAVRTGFASVICNVSEEYACHADTDPTKPFDRCPRSGLQNIIHLAKIQHGLSFLVGLELEFYLMTNEDLKDALNDAAPTAYNHWSTASGMRDVRADCLEDCVKALQRSEIEVQQFHAEPGRHMYEIATGPLSALEALDTWTQTLEIVKRTARDHGLQATFLPKPFSTLYCLGQHVHLSIHSSGVSTAVCGQIEEHFLAGILHRLPLLCNFGMPSQDSYRRFEPFALAPWVSWGTENRDAAIRKMKKGHWELRTVDATANLYLVVATFIAAGLLGVREKQHLRWKDHREFLARMDEVALKEAGIDTPLPRSLQEALDLPSRDLMGLDSLVGEKLLKFHMMVKEKEQIYLSNLTAEEKKILYFDNF